jgi:tripartite-type tricarboxylate transporter receptor subunit TctC
MTIKTIYKLLGTCAFAAVVSIGGPAAAQTDFSGERVELLVPYRAGGGTDIYARFLAPLLSKHLPGEPTVVVNNVPGAGALAGSNQFQERAEKDGTDIFAASASVTLNFAFRNPQATYELDKWNAFLSTAVGTVVYARSDLGIDGSEDIAELRDATLRMGGNNPTGGDLRTLLSLDLLGIEVQPVFGMNRGDVYAAFDRGEFNINFDTITAYEAQVVPMVEEGTAVPLFTLGFIDEEGNYGRDPAQPDLPSFLEVYEELHGEPLAGEAYDAWMTIFGLNVMASRALLLPEGVSDDVFETYTQAMRDVMAEIESDPELQARAAEVMGPGPHAIGKAAGRNLRNAVAFDDDAFEWLRNWVRETLDAEI